MKKLVIVESPSKAKTIEKYLGKEYHVIASKGHVADLPKSELGVDLEKDFRPKYVIMNKASVKLIKDNLEDASELILAVDPDREGEAIGWHIARILKMISDKGAIKGEGKPLRRIVFTEITKEAIQAAIKKPRSIDMDLVNAQQTRRILDRIVGYKLSPLLWRKIATGLSAGRVQSAAVRIVVDREEEREKFKNQEYWSVRAYLSETPVKEAQPGYFKQGELTQLQQEIPGLKFELVKIAKQKPDLKAEQDCKKIYSAINGKKFIINQIEEKESKQNPKPPFTTSTLQQAASNALGFSASRTMRIAQQLYEAGHISYMRTDSTNLSSEAVEKIRKYIGKEYGSEYVPEKPIFYKTKAVATQEAHEAIRPSNIASIADNLKLGQDQARLYDLIWRKTLSCQMKSASLINTAIKIVIDQCIFQLTSPRIIFPGFLVLYKNRLKEMTLPSLKSGQELFLNRFVAEQHFTEPAPRYTEASLIKEMEKNGIGRPSTYAPTISTITARKYVEKDGKYLFPTAVGRVVNKVLLQHFSDIVNLSFTAGMEGSLDEIAEGKLDWKKMLGDFYAKFALDLSKGEKDINKQDYVIIGKSDKKCPICTKPMVLRIGRFGQYLSCSEYPKCKGILAIYASGESSDDIAKKAETEEFKKNYQPAPKTEDGKNFVFKYGRYGYYWSHPDYPKVKEYKPLELNEVVMKQVYGDIPKSSDGKNMILRKSRFGEFWAHPDYPKKKEIIAIKKSEVNPKKKDLGLL